MLTPLALTLLTTAALPVPQRDDPPIRVRLNEEYYTRGERAKVRVRADEDGYLVVLRADGDGRVRVLFPIQPDDDGAITGRKDFEIRSRGDREAFVVNEGSGSGTVVAAWSSQPFRFDEFAKNGRWDYRALATDSTLGGDDEAGLLDLLDRMTDDRYAYDVAQYTVDDSPPRRPHYRLGYYHDPWWGYGSYYHPYYYGPRWRVGIGWGWRRRW